MLVVSAIRDVSERVAAEEPRLRLAAIVESSEDAIISKNRDAVITSWNSGAERIFGYAESEALGKPITILIPPELQDEENRILEKLRAESASSTMRQLESQKREGKSRCRLAFRPSRTQAAT